MNKTIAICDGDYAYAQHLAFYVMRESELPYETRIYRDTGELTQHQKPEETALLIISAENYDKEVKKAGFGKTMVMVGEEESSGTGEDLVRKYSPMTYLGKKVKERLEDEEELPVYRSGKHELQVIGVFCPGNQFCQSSFTLCLGQILAEYSKTLYINFESYSGLGELPQLDFKESLEDILFFNLNNRERLMARLSLTGRKLGKLELAPPIRNKESYLDILPSEWTELIRSIGEWTDYRFLVLDLTENIRGLTEIMECCDLVYALQYTGNGFAGSKMEEFRKSLQEQGRDRLYLKTRIWKLPELPLPEHPGNVECTDAELTGMIRAQLRKDLNGV